jgi:uncharacterized membrane protein YcfT
VSTGQVVSGRVAWLDAARGTAIALVVLHHAALRSASAGSAGWWVDLTMMLQTVRMPLFFLLAGLVAVRWVGDRTTWPQLLRGKVLLFVWVYLVWLGVRYTWFLLLPGGRTMTPYDELLVRLWMPAGGWFVLALAVMFVVARLVQRLPTPLVLTVASALSIAFLAGWVGTGNLMWQGVGSYLVFFLAGITLRGHVLVASERLTGASALLVVAGWAAAYLVCAAAGVTEAPGVGFALRVAGVAAGVSVGLLLQHVTTLRVLGRGTLAVYLTHQLLVVTAVAWLSSTWDFAGHPLLHLAAPLVLVAVLLPLSYGWGRLAPRIGLGWLFDVPERARRSSGDRHGPDHAPADTTPVAMTRTGHPGRRV